jgi:hypothetical protein
MMIVKYNWNGVEFDLKIPRRAYDVLELVQRLLPNHELEPSPDNLRAIHYYLAEYILEFTALDDDGEKITKKDIETVEFLDMLPNDAIIGLCNKLLSHVGYEPAVLERFNNAYQQLYLAEPCPCGFCKGKTKTRKANCALKDVEQIELNLLTSYLILKDDPITDSVPYWVFQLKSEAKNAERKFNKRKQELKQKEEQLRQKLNLKK